MKFSVLIVSVLFKAVGSFTKIRDEALNQAVSGS